MKRMGSADPFFSELQVAPRREPHDLCGSRPQTAVVAERAGVEDVPLDHVGQRLDVTVRVHGPVGVGDEAVVVEDHRRAHAHLFRIAVAVEGEVPSGVEPPAILMVDLVWSPDPQHASLALERWGLFRQAPAGDRPLPRHLPAYAEASATAGVGMMTELRARTHRSRCLN